MRRGLNHGGYHGERIDIAAVVRETLAIAEAKGWEAEQLLALEPAPVVALRRRSPASLNTPTRRVYLSAGIHGDEPAGPLVLRHLLRRDRWPGDTELWVCPCLNPTGFAANLLEIHPSEPASTTSP